MTKEYVFKSKKDYVSQENTIVETLNFSEIFGDFPLLKNARINTGGWQSWSPSYEVADGKKQDLGSDCLVPAMECIIDFPETKFKASKNLILAQFVCYIKTFINDKETYFVLASVGQTLKNENSEELILPPVQFVIDKKHSCVSIELCDKGKNWKKDEIQAKILAFTANSYFELKDKLKEIFDCGQFKQIESLGKKALGWESWYNHYTNINEKIILDSLNALNEKTNILTLLAKNSDSKDSNDKDADSSGSNSSESDSSGSKKSPESKVPSSSGTPIIFQIDDGWEASVGDWTINKEKFPNGLKPLVDKIEENGFIPGLWIAPFLLYDSNPIALEHPEWVLKKENSETQKVCNGMNPFWNGLKPVRCLDLSRKDVLDYLDSIMETAINEWGFRYLKLDFMYAGMRFGNFSEKGSAFEFYQRAIKLLTKRKTTKDGKQVFYLGCGVPMEQSFKCFPLSRIGCDTLEHWKNKKMRFIRWNGRNEAYLNLKDTLARSFWDKTIFANDPDVIFIREKNCTLTENEKLLIAQVNAIFGSQIMYSDDVNDEQTENEKAFTKKIFELYKKYKNEEFSVQETEDDFYKIESRSGNYKGTIDLRNGKNHEIKID